MRRILVILMFMLAMGMVFAADELGIKEGAVAGGEGAYIPVTLTLNNTNAGQVVIGFSTHPVTTAEDQSSNKKTIATLTPDPATGTASLSAKDSTYVFWQIQSSDTLYVQLSTDSLTNSGSEIEWKITDETSSSTTLIDGTGDGTGRRPGVYQRTAERPGTGGVCGGRVFTSQRIRRVAEAHEERCAVCVSGINESGDGSSLPGKNYRHGDPQRNHPDRRRRLPRKIYSAKSTGTVHLSSYCGRWQRICGDRRGCGKDPGRRRSFHQTYRYFIVYQQSAK